MRLLCSKTVSSRLPYYQEHSRVMSVCQSLFHPCYLLFLCGSLNQAPIHNRSYWIWWCFIFDIFVQGMEKRKNRKSVRMRNDNLWSCLIRKYVIVWGFCNTTKIIPFDIYMYALCGSLKSRSTGMFGEQIRYKPIVVVNVSFIRNFWMVT